MLRVFEFFRLSPYFEIRFKKNPHSMSATKWFAQFRFIHIYTSIYIYLSLSGIYNVYISSRISNCIIAYQTKITRATHVCVCVRNLRFPTVCRHYFASIDCWLQIFKKKERKKPLEFVQLKYYKCVCGLCFCLLCPMCYICI